MQCVELIVSIAPSILLCELALRVPLRCQLLEVVVDVLLELTDGLRGERMRHGLALTGVFGTVAGIEKATMDGDEGIVVVTGY